MKVGIEPSVWKRREGGSCNLFPIVHSALRLPLYSFLVNPSLSSLICVSFSLPHSSSPSIHFTFSVHPSIHPLAHSSSPCVSTLSLCVRLSTLSLPLPSVWNLSTSGQPHLLGCPQDINRTQRLVSVYQRPLNKRIASPSFCIID